MQESHSFTVTCSLYGWETVMWAEPRQDAVERLFIDNEPGQLNPSVEWLLSGFFLLLHAADQSSEPGAGSLREGCAC